MTLKLNSVFDALSSWLTCTVFQQNIRYTMYFVCVPLARDFVYSVDMPDGDICWV